MLENEVSKTLDRLMSGRRERHVAVAVSGGADSMALALLAAHWAKRHRITLTCLTINHGLRKSATEEARRVSQWFKKLKIKHEILSYQGKRPASNIMEEARKIRYELLFEWCRENLACLLVAHNLEDQAETFLLRLQRGSGLVGLACMPESALRKGVWVMRPLLSVSRRHLESFLKKKHQAWVEDPTNADPQYARNALRMALESNPHTKNELSQRLFETARAMGRARVALENATNTALENCVSEPVPGICALDDTRYAKLEEEVALRLLSQLLDYVNPAEKKTRYDSLHSLHQKIIDEEISKPLTLAGCLIFSDKTQGVLFCREAKRLPPASTLKKKELLHWDRFEFTAKSDRYTVKPLGTHATRLMEQKKGKKTSVLPPKALASLPSVWKKDADGVETLLWAPHMSDTPLKKAGVLMRYNPSKKLEITPFAYCRAMVYTVV